MFKLILTKENKSMNIKLGMVMILSVVALGLNGCTKGCSTADIGCSIEKTVVSGVAPVIATQLQCSNVDAISNDLNNIIGKVGLCKQQLGNSGKLSLPGPICSMFVDLVVNNVANIAIPASWGCSASNAKGLLKDVVMMACQKL